MPVVAVAESLSGAGAHSRMPDDMGALTSLRALLAWWVVAYHIGPLAPFGLSQSMPLLAKGPVMVDCFFVLSGFVLFHMHATAFNGANRRRATIKFLFARLARLYPVHITMLVVFVALIGGLRLTTGFHPSQPGLFSPGALLAQIFLLNGFAVPCGGWNFPSWSISSETLAYVCAPFLFRRLSRSTDQLRFAAMVLIGLFVIAAVEFGWFSPFLMAGPRVVLEFCVGALLRDLAGRHCAGLRRLQIPALAAGWLAIAALAPTMHKGLFLAAILWTLLFLSVTPGWRGRLGSIGRYLGESSYAVYMGHALVLTIWAGLASRVHLGPLAAPIPAAITLCLSIQALAALLHQFVERPGRIAVKAMGDRVLQPNRQGLGEPGRSGGSEQNAGL